MSGLVDPGTAFGRRVVDRLTGDEVAWLVTVDPQGSPQPTPVWFWWDGGDSLAVRTRPRTAKLRNLRANPRASLHLNSAASGGDVVVLIGEARTDDKGLADDERAAYGAKYADGMRGLGTTPEEFFAAYCVTLRFVAARVRGF